MKDSDLNIFGHTLTTLDGREISVSWGDSKGVRSYVTLSGDRDDEHLPFQFDLNPDAARRLGEVLIRGAENVAREEKEREAA